MVDLALNEVQQALQQTAREFLTREAPKSVVREIDDSPEGFSSQLWGRIVELGWVGLPLPEEAGGTGGDLLDTAVLAEELGRAALSSPYVPSVVACLALADLGREDLQGLVRSLATEPRVATWAILETDGRFETSSCQTEARPDGGQGYRLYGHKPFVPYGHVAELILCPARLPGGGLGVFAVEGGAAGLSKRPMVTVGGDRLADLTLEGVAVGGQSLLASGDEADALLARARDRLTALKCAEMVGGIAQTLAMAVEHAQNRIQFGHPIGAFQAVQHHCADAATLADGARLATYQAIWQLANGLPAAREVSIAKVIAGHAYQRATSVAAQIHGGLGAMLEYDLHYYVRGAKAGELLFGTATEHLERIARHLHKQSEEEMFTEFRR